MVYVYALFSWGVKLRLFDSNPAIGLVPPEPKTERRPLTDDELVAVMTLADHRDYWKAYLYAGLRASEFSELPTASVEVDTPAPYLEVLGKGNKKRIVPLEGPAVEHFRMLKVAAVERGDSRICPVRVGSLRKYWQAD